MSLKPDFKVIIVGGSVSGLTLAHSLYHAGIDFVVLEKGREIAFGGGASIGLQPHGLRIMDQMGMYPSILGTTKPIHEAVHRRADGSVVARSHFARQIEERHGYPILFFERSELLEILYDHLPVKEKVLTSHEVVTVESSELGATVTTKNGSTFRGDIVVGADGINSTVRKSLWELTKARDPAAAKKAETLMTSEYYCAFGVSVHDFKDPDLAPGTSQILSNEAQSNIVITSTKNRVFWFLILKHDKKHVYPNIPRFSNEQAKAVMDSVVSDFRATEKTTMKDVWDKRTKFAMVSLEEVVFDDWAEGRLVLVGDSAHKVTPNAGHGGNTAIESAAVLANLLYDAKSGTKGSLDYAGLQGICKEYRENRKKRVDFVCTASSAATRIQACENLAWKTVASLIPLLGEDFEVNAASDMIMGGEALKFIEYQGKEGNIPWAGWTPIGIENDSKLFSSEKIVQIFQYLVIPAVAVWFIYTFQIIKDVSLSTTTDAYGFDPAGIFNYFLDFNGSKASALPSLSTPFSKEIPTKLWTTFVACMNLLPIGAIIALEGCRSNNAKLFSRLWATGITLQIGGLSTMATLFLFAHCVESNLSTRNPKGYILPLKYSRSLIPAILISVAMILLLMLTASGLMFNSSQISQQLLRKVFQTFPIIPYLIALVLGQTKYSKSKSIAFGHEDVSSVQGALILSALLSAISHIVDCTKIIFNIRTLSLGSLSQLVLGGNVPQGSLQSKYLIFNAVALIWCYVTALKVLAVQKRTWEIKVRMAVRMAAGTVLMGPGATIGFLWLWREDKIRCMDAQWRYVAEAENISAST